MNNLSKLIETGYRMIDVARSMQLACQRKKKKVYSHSRFVVSFFLSRAREMFESFLIFIKENRIIDSALLLRSLLEMGISLGYIFAADIDEAENEKRALRYLLDGDKQQLKLINSNLNGFKDFDPNIEKRRDELKDQIKTMESAFRDKFGDDNWDLPCIKERAKLSKSTVLQNAYNQSYRDLSNIEHHSILFGQHYVDSEKCEPKKEINHLKQHPQFKPAVSVFLFRIVFVEILSVFNDVFRLKWTEHIEVLRKLQDAECLLLKE
jgi:hypothetical protein